jgi:hypothetical protein
LAYPEKYRVGSNNTIQANHVGLKGHGPWAILGKAPRNQIFLATILLWRPPLSSAAIFVCKEALAGVGGAGKIHAPQTAEKENPA